MIGHLCFALQSHRKILLVAAVWIALAMPAFAQAGPPPGGAGQSEASPAKLLEFEVATIKPVKDPNPNRTRDREEGRRFTAFSTTLSDLILMAYHLDRWQTAGAPAWVTTDEYDVDAVAESEAEFRERGPEMLQQLLADRFKLKFHWEQRKLSVYVLSVAKSGPRLKPAGANGQQSASCQRFGVCTFRSDTLQRFAGWLSYAVLDRPVVDKTGIPGVFDFTLRWTPNESQFAGTGIRVPQPTDDPNAPPELFTAIQEQLGLKLEPMKAPVDVLVVDHVERPSEN